MKAVRRVLAVFLACFAVAAIAVPVDQNACYQKCMDKKYGHENCSYICGYT
jgi:hypothetical protein